MDIAISIRQPWAALIVLGWKDIENRTWALPARYKGQRVSIHTGIKPDRAVLEYARQPIREAAAILATASGVDILDFERRAKAFPEAFELGGIVGRATLINSTLNGSNSYWANDMDGVWHWQVSAPRPVPFAACKGSLGFFKPSIEVVKLDDFAEFGPELAEAKRRELGLTCRELSKLTGMRPSHISEFEHGLYVLSLAEGERLRTALGISSE